MHSHVNGLPFLTALPVVSWSCGAALRSVWWRPARRSLSPPEPSAITSCVTWPIGRRCTSRPRWSERRYSRASCTQINDLVPMSFTVDNKHQIVLHIQPVFQRLPLESSSVSQGYTVWCINLTSGVVVPGEVSIQNFTNSSPGEGKAPCVKKILWAKVACTLNHILVFQSGQP